jgi:CTP:molybdopterin cytidylyltransferase MocA
LAVADLPWLQREAALGLWAAANNREGEAFRAFEGETPAHPVLLRGSMIERARQAPDAGLGSVLREVPTGAVDCSGLGVARDVDSPADLEP